MKIHLSPPKEYNGAKKSLILAGGGMRLAYQAGVLKAMEEEGLFFYHADGTSGGTINLAMLFSGLSPVEMCDRWRKLKIKEFVSYMKMDNYLKPARMVAFGDADGIIHKVFPHLGINISNINHAEGMPGTFNVCNYTDKINETITNDRLTMDYLVAGISLPVFMPPVPIRNKIYTDSVWIKDANLTEAVRRGAEEIWLVWAIGNISQYKNGAFNQYVHMIEMSANGGLSLEFDYINELNKRIINGDSPYGQTKPVELHVIKPEYPLPLDPDLYFNKINTATLIDLGYADAKQYLKNISPVPFSPSVTKMKDQGIVVCLRRTMQGVLTSSFKGNLLICLSLTVQNLGQFISGNGKGLQIAAHIQGSEAGIISSAYYTHAEVIKVKGKKNIKFCCRFTSDKGNYFLISEISIYGKWHSLYKGIFRKMKVRFYKGNDEKGLFLEESTFSPDPKQSGDFITGIHILNESSVWGKLKSKQKFIAFLSN